MMNPAKAVAIMCAMLVSLGGLAGAPEAQATAGERPAVMFVDSHGRGIDFEFVRWLVRDGLSVSFHSGRLIDDPLTWDDVKDYNALIMTGLGEANADGSLGEDVQQTIDVLRRFINEGGGVLLVPSRATHINAVPPQLALLEPLGLTPQFDEMVSDREPPVIATAWRVRFAYTSAIQDSPMTQDVRGLWLPIDTRAGGEDHLVPLATDSSWQLLVKGSPSSYTITVPFNTFARPKESTAGCYSSNVPLVASREVGKGRIVVCGIDFKWLWGKWAGSTLEGIVRVRGLHDTPSDGYTLVANSLQWLSEPSMTSGALGGATTDPKLLENPFVTTFCKATDWSQVETAPFPREDQIWPGVIGARTVLSGGKGTVADWVDAAKRAGLKYVVFLSDFAELSPEHWADLQTACTEATTVDFAAVPGFRIRDVIGNNYFYAGPSLRYPPREVLTPDGKRFDAAPDAKQRLGQLASTTLTYVHSMSSYKLTGGNYDFSHDASPVANWFSDFDATGVITRTNGTLVDDATETYLQLVDAGQSPLPLALELMDDPAQLAQPHWQTVLRVGAGKQSEQGNSESANVVSAYFGQWHFYPDNPTSIYVTEGPQIDHWSLLGPRDYGSMNHGDFVWQNQRWRVGGSVHSEIGLKEVAVYDGPTLFRRFLPGGGKTFEFALDLQHDKQHNLVLIATDTAGHRAISHEVIDRNHRLEEFNCADRNNQLSYGYSTRQQDGTSVLLGGNQTLATPSKRICDLFISPSGVFKNDTFLGAPAFDGAAKGEPQVYSSLQLDLQDGTKLAGPRIGDARRLLHTGDVNMGEGLCDYRFGDNVPSVNVWWTLWKAEPSHDFTAEHRAAFFQVDPDSPLAVFMWRIRLTLQADLPTRTANVAFITLGQSQLWAVRGSDGTVLAGNNEDTARSDVHEENLPFDLGSYAAALDSPLGGAAVFSLTEGLTASWYTPKTNRISLSLSGNQLPQKKGETCEVKLVILGIPRSTKYTRMFPPRSTQVVEQFRREFGLSDAGPGYQVDVQAGTIAGQHYLLEIDGADDQAFSGVLTGKLVSTLPIVVGSLHDRWSAFLYDRKLKAARPLGVFESKAWVTVPMRGKEDLFVGHPVTCDNPDIFLQLTQTGEDAWTLEVHNPTDTPVNVQLHLNHFFDPLAHKQLPAEPVTVAAGASKQLSL